MGFLLDFKKKKRRWHLNTCPPYVSIPVRLIFTDLYSQERIKLTKNNSLCLYYLNTSECMQTMKKLSFLVSVKWPCTDWQKVCSLVVRLDALSISAAAVMSSVLQHNGEHRWDSLRTMKGGAIEKSDQTTTVICLDWQVGGTRSNLSVMTHCLSIHVNLLFPFSKKK